MNQFSKNINFLKGSNTDLYNIVVNDKPLINLNVTEVESQNFIVEKDGKRCFLHSIYDLEEELSRMFEGIDKDSETMLIFGLGAGHVFEYLKNNFTKINHLIIIEPSLQIFNKAMNEFDLSEQFNYFPRITLIVNKSVDYAEDVMKGILKETTQFQIVYHFNYKHLFNEYYDTLLSLLVKAIRNRQVTTTTTGLSTYNWLENSISNFTQTSIPIEKIASIFKNRPAIIVAAGPSLNKNIHLIKELKKYAFVIAVGSAIKILDTHKIVPHFRMALDGLPREQKILDGVNTGDAPIIFGSKLYKGILPAYNQKKIRFIEETDYVGNYLYKKRGIEHLKISVGPSVANFALSLLIQVGCTHIIFMGQDLCYSSQETHASGTNNEEENKINNTQKNNYIQTENIYGEPVYTTNNLITMKYSLEKVISKHLGKIVFTNATEGGLNILGTVNKTAKEALGTLISEVRDTNDTFSLVEDKLIDDKSYQQNIDQALISLNEDLIELYLLNEDKINYLKKINKTLNRKININRLSNDIEYINKIDMKINQLAVFKEVVYPALSTIFDVFNLNMNLNGKTDVERLKASYTIASKKALELKKYVAFALRDLNVD